MFIAVFSPFSIGVAVPGFENGGRRRKERMSRRKKRGENRS